MLTQVAQFTGILDLGLNLYTGAPSVTRAADQARMEQFIDWYEREYYANSFGADMAGRIVTVIDNPDTDDDEAKELIGMLQSPTPTPMACYIYFKYLEMGQFHASPTGVDTASDATLQNPRWLQMRAWNAMVDAHIGLFQDSPYTVSRGMCEHLNSFGI